MEDTSKEPQTINMILYIIDNDKREPSQNWEIIPKKKYVIGRSKKEADITLNEKLLSRRHAEITYFDSKTIMVKDLDSRNGTFINKERIESSKEIFFSCKDVLSFGTTNNEILFFDQNEQSKEKEEESSDNNKEVNEQEKNNISKYEEINTDKKISQEIKNNKENVEKERENVVNYEKSEKSKSKLNEGDKNNENSLSNRETLNQYNNKNNIQEKFPRRSRAFHDKQEEYYDNRQTQRTVRRSHRDISNSRERNEDYRSRSRETFPLQSRHNSKGRSSRTSPHNSHIYFNNERRRDFERGRMNDLRYKDKLEIIKREREEMENKRRQDFEAKQIIRELKNENYRRAHNQRTNYYTNINNNKTYNDYQRNDNKIEGVIDKIMLNPGKIDIQFEPNGNGRELGYIKCNVEGYIYLKIKNNK